MKLKLYQLDAFTTQLFHGNPAAVCVLDGWLADDILLNIAQENNLSETAFIVPRDGDYHLRWFTISGEMDLCGHATLASAYVVLNILEPQREYVTFHSQSGLLSVCKTEDQQYEMDFPALELNACDMPADITSLMGLTPVEMYRSKYNLIVLETEKQVRELELNFEAAKQIDALGLIFTARGDHVDFVSRFFSLRGGVVVEDPVTGSAHCSLTPYWAEKLGKQKLHAKQLSPRGGEIFCELKGERVILTGAVVPYFSGEITLL